MQAKSLSIDKDRRVIITLDSHLDDMGGVWGRVTHIYAPLKFGDGSVISSHTLLDMWLLIHAWIKVKPCKLKWPQVSGVNIYEKHGIV